jgi:hypothetical protein
VLAAALKRLTPPLRPTSTDDIGWVQGWLDRGHAPASIAAIVEARMASHRGSPITSLGYFDQVIREAGEKRERAAASPAVQPVAPPAPDPEDDPTLAVGDTPEAQFQRVRQKLKAQIGPGEYRAWVKKAAFVAIEDGEAIVSLPVPHTREYVRNTYGDRLLAMWRAENPAIRRMEFTVASAARKAGSGI